MAWTEITRPKYRRDGLRYASDLSDEEWAEIEPQIPPAKRGGNKPTVDMREVVNGIMYILSTGCPWHAMPKDLPPKSTVQTGWHRGRLPQPQPRFSDEWNNVSRALLRWQPSTSSRCHN